MKAAVVFVALISLMSLNLASSASDDSIFTRIRREHQQLLKDEVRRTPSQTDSTFTPTAQPVNLQHFDVSHYKLVIRIDPEGSLIEGTVTVTGSATGSISSIDLNAEDNLEIDSVKLGAASLQFSRAGGHLSVALPAQLASAQPVSLDIAYHGSAVTTGRLGGGMLVRTHGPSSFTVMANLSEPFAAPTWWPCIDDPRDKATVEVEATAPHGYEVASNGLLISKTVNSDQSTTFVWRENYPLATYLVSIAATNFEKFEDSYLALDQVTRMPLVYYVYPEHLDLARAKFGVTRSAMEIFANLFGEYPFLNEKYGMAEFPWSGAMEHQTMTSMGQGIVGSLTNSGQSVIAHELAHQWWGDVVTMNTWDDIWLNEGFATYCEVLFFEHSMGLSPGDLMSRSYDDGKVSGSLGGTVTAENAADPFDDQGAIYDKGGWVLHMLRHIVGDQKFFDALRDYRSRHEFGTASTADLQRSFEEQYGGSLDWFFQQWIYAPGRPAYKLSTNINGPDSTGAFSIKLTLKQKQSIEIPGRTTSVFIMPLDVTIHYADGTSEVRQIFNDSRKQKFTLTVMKRPTSVGLDESHWVLKKG